jgi:hypothetical protein
MTHSNPTNKDRILAQLEVLELILDDVSEDPTAFDATEHGPDFDAALERIFARLDEAEAAAIAAGQPPSFIPDPEEATTAARIGAAAAAAVDPITRVIRDGIRLLSFAADLLKQGEEAFLPAAAGVRHSGARSQLEMMPWRPSDLKPRHLDVLGSDEDGWTLFLEARETGDTPEACPEIDLRVNGMPLDDDEIEIAYDDGQIEIGFAIEGTLDRIEISEDRAGSVIIYVLTRD